MNIAFIHSWSHFESTAALLDKAISIENTRYTIDKNEHKAYYNLLYNTFIQNKQNPYLSPSAL